MSTIHLTGRIDFEAATMARQRLLAEIECGDDLYIELSGVTGIDSAGLEVLVEIFQVGRQIGCAVHLAGVREDVMKMVRNESDTAVATAVRAAYPWLSNQRSHSCAV